MRRIFLLTASLAVLLAAVSVGYVRFAAGDAQGWHVDPMTAAVDSHASSWRAAPTPGAGVDAITPVYVVPAEDLARALDEVALSDASTRRIAGTPEELWMSYEQRSRWMRFPDYISVRVLGLGEGSTLAIFSRPRFGREDLGVNRERVESWLRALQPLEE